MEMHARTIPTRRGVYPCGSPQHRCQEQHDGRQAVDHSHDAEWRRPIAQQIDAHAVGPIAGKVACREAEQRSEEHTSELQSLMRISYAVFCLKKKTHTNMQRLY